MKFVLLFIIKIYWLFIPAGKRRTCLYAKSCSRYVYEITSNLGLIAGTKALMTRIKTCRPNHEVLLLERENVLLIKLSNGDVLQHHEISTHVISDYTKGMEMK